MAYTLGDIETQARNILNDTIQEAGAYRYSSQEIYDAFNDALLQTRAKRPDAFLALGLRNTIPQYSATTDATVPFPLDLIYFPAFLFYVCGRVELKEDTFADDKRSVTLMKTFTQMLLSVS
jgi:hypothetical protein